MALTQSQRGTVIGVVAVVIVLVTTVGNAVADHVADGRGRDLRADLVRTYRGTTVDDVRVLDFLDEVERSGHAPQITADVDGGVRARYEVGALTEDRCVTVFWDDDGVDVSAVERC